MKKCTLCKEEKPLSDYYSKGKGKHSRCKKCCSLYQKKHYQNNKQDYKERAYKSNRKISKRNKLYFKKYKQNKGCYFCNESEPCCLDFHHLDPSAKEKNISYMTKSANSIETILKEVEKCIVVCSNCHRKLHAKILSL